MKKNLAKRIVLGLLTGAVLMCSSVAWAGNGYNIDGNNEGESTLPADSISIKGSVYSTNDGSGSVKSVAIGVGSEVGSNLTFSASNSVAVGYNAQVVSANSVALGAQAKVNGGNSVALGYGSVASDSNVVSVGSGDTNINGAPATRKIINVTGGVADTDAATYGQVKAVSDVVGTGVVRDNEGKIDGVVVTNFNFTNGDNLTETVQNMAKTLDPVVKMVYNDFYTEDEVDSKFLSKLDATLTYLTQTQADGRYVQIGKNDATVENQPQISIDADGQMVFGSTSSWIDGDGEGFFAGRISTDPNDGHTADNAKASITSDGSIKGAGGKFKVDGATGNVTATNLYNKDEVDAKLNDKADKTALEEETNQRVAEDLKLKQQIAEFGGGNSEAINAINQRLDKTNAKINKVGAGAAALAALHPLEYDPDDKLTFSAGMGNYAGENAAALGAFYRPNEKFMLSLGGTMGNGENMVNLGISIGLDKPNGFAKMSKRELIQEVNAVKAENEAMKAEMAEMKAMLQELLAKK